MVSPSRASPATDLRAGENDGLPKVLQHEGECRGRVAHGVCAMEDNECIERLVVSGDVLGDQRPVLHRHVAGVEERIVLVDAVDDAIVVEGHAVCVCARVN